MAAEITRFGVFAGLVPRLAVSSDAAFGAVTFNPWPLKLKRPFDQRNQNSSSTRLDRATLAGGQNLKSGNIEKNISGIILGFRRNGDWLPARIS